MVSFPSIFNDVLGPVMRGPSSSHSAASLRIGRMALDLMDSDIKNVVVDYDPNGSLVTTHLSQGSDLGLTGGILGWETDDARLPNYRDEVAKAGIKIEVRYLDYGAEHPNTYRLALRSDNKEHTMTAISTGGGMIEVQQIDGVPVSMKGDYFETLIFLNKRKVKIGLGSASKNAEVILSKLGLTSFFEIVIDGNKVNKSKPHPEVFLRGSSALGVAPEKCLVFEDSASGIISAKAAGMTAVAIGNPDKFLNEDFCYPDFLSLVQNDLDKLF